MNIANLPGDPHKPDDDFTCRFLIERVVSGDVEAWKCFLERIHSCLDTLLSRYSAGDEDRLRDLMVYVLEQLKKPDDAGREFIRLRQFLAGLDRYGSEARFTNWLATVVNNLVSDYFREKQGRRTLPVGIRRMDLASQEIYKLLFWNCLTEGETYETVRSRSPVGREEFDAIVEKIHQRLNDGNRWKILTDMARRRARSYPGRPSSREREDPADRLMDSSVRSNPLASSITLAHCKKAMAMRMALHRALLDLPLHSIMLLICRYTYKLTAVELSRVFGLPEAKSVYSRLNAVHRHLRKILQAQGFAWEDIQHGLPRLDGFLDDLQELDTHVICPRFEPTDDGSRTGLAEPLLA